MQLSCLNNIIGLSDSECNCYSADRPVDYNVSRSGYFITDPKFGLNLDMAASAEDCEKGSAWDILQKARNLAVKQFVADFSGGIMNNRDLKYEAFNGVAFSEKIGLQNIQTRGSYAGVRIEPDYKDGTYASVRGVQLAFKSITAPQDVDVYIYNNISTTPIASTTVNIASAGVFYSAQFSSPVLLDLCPLEEDVYYYIVYEIPAGWAIAANKIERSCSCNKRHYQKTDGFMSFVCDVIGIQTELANLDSLKDSNGYANGIRLDAEFNCDFLSWLCDLSVGLEDSGDMRTYTYNGKSYNLGVAMAISLGHIAAYYTANLLLSSNNINKNLVVNGELLEKAMEENMAKYNAYMGGILEKTPLDFNDCFACKSRTDISLNTIRI